MTTPTPQQRPATRRATTADELLAFEQRRALGDLGRHVRNIGHDLVAATELRRHVRARPLLTTGASVALGVVAGRVIARSFETHEGAPRAARSHARPALVPALVLASLRLLGR